SLRDAALSPGRLIRHTGGGRRRGFSLLPGHRMVRATHAVVGTTVPGLSWERPFRVMGGPHSTVAALLFTNPGEFYPDFWGWWSAECGRRITSRHAVRLSDADRRRRERWWRIRVVHGRVRADLLGRPSQHQCRFAVFKVDRFAGGVRVVGLS